MNAESEYLLEKLLWNYRSHFENDFISWYKKSKKLLKSLYDLPGNQLKIIDNTMEAST